MATSRGRARTILALSAVFIFALSFPSLSSLARDKEKGPRIHLTPLFQKGQTLRYRIDTQTAIEGTTTSPISNPEGAKTEDRSMSVELTIDVLGPPPPAPSSGSSSPSAAPPDTTSEAARLRVTYDFADATSTSDAYDPAAAAFESAYKNLQGRSMEFTLSPSGSITNVIGLEDLFANPSVAQSVKSWMSGFNYSGGLPQEGIAVGQKWSREIPADDLPLGGLVWRLESTYLRDEPCAPRTPPDTETPPRAASPAPPTPANPPSDVCAVILTESTLVRKGSSHADSTPPDYLRNGLRTSGTWIATGESLDSLSLHSGWIVLSTRTVTDQMDYEIKSVRSGKALHHTGSVKTRSQISMLPPVSPAPRAPSR